MSPEGKKRRPMVTLVVIIMIIIKNDFENKVTTSIKNDFENTFPTTSIKAFVMHFNRDYHLMSQKPFILIPID